MDILHKEDLLNLVSLEPGWTASIFLPAEKVNPDLDKHRIRLKNALNMVEKQFEARGMRGVEARGIIAPARDLLNDVYFWQHQSHGLALFLAKDIFYNLRLPLRFKKTVVVKRRFYMKPLLPLLSRQNNFFILALSQKNIRMFACTVDRVDEIDLSEVDAPTSIDEALWADQPEKHLQYHTETGTPGGAGGERAAMYHGQGVNEQDQKEKLERFFHKLDEALNPILNDQSAPLVLAGVEYLLPIYRQASSYQNIIEEGISGNPEGWSAEQLHERALPLINPIFQHDLRRARARFRQLSGQNNPQATTDLTAVVKAAYNQRIDTLFVARGVLRWGIFDPQNQTVMLTNDTAQDLQEMLDFSAAYTLMNGGEVYALPRARMPLKSEVAAVLRY